MDKKIEITLERSSEGSSIYLKIPKKMEVFFAKLSKNEIKESEVWKYANGNGAKFYILSKNYQDFERKLGNGSVYNDYGDGLIRNETINLAPLRSVGAWKGVELKSDRFVGNNMDLEFYVRELGVYAKKIWENIIAKKKIKALITFEV